MRLFGFEITIETGENFDSRKFAEKLALERELDKLHFQLSGMPVVEQGWYFKEKGRDTVHKGTIKHISENVVSIMPSHRKYVTDEYLTSNLIFIERYFDDTYENL